MSAIGPYIRLLKSYCLPIIKCAFEGVMFPIQLMLLYQTFKTVYKIFKVNGDENLRQCVRFGCVCQFVKTQISCIQLTNIYIMPLCPILY